MDGGEQQEMRGRTSQAPMHTCTGPVGHAWAVNWCISLPPPTCALGSDVLTEALSHPQHAHRDLWDVDSQALADSDPQMLALAVRALSISGLPKGV